MHSISPFVGLHGRRFCNKKTLHYMFPKVRSSLQFGLSQGALSDHGQAPAAA